MAANNPEIEVQPVSRDDVTPQQAANGGAPPDGDFTETSAVSMGSSREGAAGPEHSSVSDRLHNRKERFRDKVEQEQSEAKTKVRKAFGLRQERQHATQQWLHGTLYVEIHEAEHLPGDPTLVSVFPRFCNLGLMACKKVVTGKERAPQGYVSLKIGNMRPAYTSFADRTFHPKWEENFAIPVATSPKDLEFQVKDTDSFGSPHLGTATLEVEKLLQQKKFDGWLPLRGRTGRVQGFGKAQIRVTVTYVTVDEELKQHREPEHRFDVKASYFQPRSGARLTFYSDSHHDPGQTPTVKLGNGEAYRTGGLWKDMYQAILNAKHFVYIAGWSVWVHNMLVRDKDKPMVEDEQHLKLGTLLKRKAEEGCKVCVLIWDDRSSIQVGGTKTGGMLSTHDEETFTYFQGTGVKVGKSLRGNEKTKNFLKGVTTATNFTHHQKVVCVDAPDADAPGPDIDPATGTPTATEQGRAEAAGGEVQPSTATPQRPADSSSGKRRLLSFVGGIDVTDGRYDTHEHPLFRTLHTEHSADFYQDCLPGVDGEAGGPRLPWHDQHCRLEGPPAFDVLQNFQQRWQHPSSSAGAAEDGLFDLKQARDLVQPQDVAQPDTPEVRVIDPRDPHAFRAQVFRSIDSQCVIGFPSTNQEAYERGLKTDRGNTVDRSVQNAYIHAIRTSKRFLYIENQYFLGGSGEWENKAHAEICDNLVPVEIALRCARAIQSGEPFAAYIVIPMWPEGIPEAGSIQEVLLWQTNTIRMMYRIVGQALAAKGDNNAHPRDYLNVFCPGKREPIVEGVPPPPKAPKKGSRQELVQKTRRFMIYVHAKMLIIDDEYLLEGSANINQRSQDGARDTEIAMGAWQPFYRPEGRGQVYGHRMTCWEEHLGAIEDGFQNPNDLNTVRRVRQLAKANWDAYTSTKVQELPHGHLLPYPLEVAQNGVVRTLPGYRHFPDTKADVLGKKLQVPVLIRGCLGKTEFVVTT